MNRLLPSKRFALLLLVPAACSLVACGSKPDGVSLGTTSDALAPDTLTGHWDILGSNADGLTRSGTIDLAATSLTVSFGDYALRFTDAPSGATAVYEDRSQGALVTTAIPTAHAPLTVQTGILPLALGGDWALADAHRPGAGCTGHLADDGFAGQCANVKIQPDWDDFYASHPYPFDAWNGWSDPWVTPPAVQAWNDAAARFEARHELPGANGDMTGVRVKALSSSFGDLGGEWDFVGSGGAICHATLKGATISATCSGIQGDYQEADANGTLAVTFTRGLASGTTSKGIEFLARRVHG